VLALSLSEPRADARGGPPDRPSFGGAWDAQVASLSCLSLLLFALGHPEQARARRDEALARSRKLGHPHILAYGLLMAASFDWLSRAPDADLELEPLIAVCAEQRFPHWLAVGTMLRAHALATRGATAEGLALARRALVEYGAMGFAWGQTTLLVVLAHCCEKARQSEEAFDALTTGLAVAGRTGERYFEAELHRLRGEWLAAHRQERPEEAEAELRRGLDAAGRQSARMWELRAATSLGRLWRDQARFEEARALVAPVYASFTEGLSIPDLADARSLLDSLP
jgi:predicted ATPase